MTVDVLAVGAHPDDVELGVGGTLARLAASGHGVGVLDLTRGELSSRGTPEERNDEAEAAAEILHVAIRENAGLPDGAVANTTEQRRVVMSHIRRLKPRVLLLHHPEDRHPDHTAASALTKDANFFAGLHTLDDGQEPHRARHLYYFHPYFEAAGAPHAVMDVSEYFARKLDALKAYRSQFHNPDYVGHATYISSAEFWEAIRSRARYWGSRIDVTYGEPLYVGGPLALNSLPELEQP